MIQTIAQNFSLDDECYRFTVDNTQPVVALSIDVPSYTGARALRVPSSGEVFFVAGDGLNLLSVGICLPQNYVFATGVTNGGAVLPLSRQLPDIELRAKNVFNEENIVFRGAFPFCNYEMAIGQDFFYGSNDAVGGKYYVEANILNIDKCGISMLNVPDSENGKIYYCPIFAKVSHTLAMVA